MIEEEVETVYGTTIPLRELTKEEANREITYERFESYHSDAGEDFTDQYDIINHQILGGFLMTIRRDWSKQILHICNTNEYTIGGASDYLQMYEDEFGDREEAVEAFYTDLAEFINLTGNLKKNVNQVLIQTEEHYAD